VPQNINEVSLGQNLEKYMAMARRRRWWFLLTAVTVALGAIVLSFVLPDRYKSEATILVEQQQVPERYVVPNTTANLDQALQAMKQDVLSRSRLLEMIHEFHLYPSEQKRLGPGELARMMRKDITIDPLETDGARKGINAFKISYTASTPLAAEEVTNRLTSLFIDEDVRTQEQRDVGTTDFLQTQLAAAQADLDIKETRLRDFKMQNLGELPEQQQGNLQILDGLQMQLQNTIAALSRANEQRVFLQSLLTQYQGAAPGAGGSLSSSAVSPIETVQIELARLQSERATLLASYSAQYPDVKKVDAEIARTQALLAQLKAGKSTGASVKTAPAAAASTSFTSTDSTIAQLSSQLKENQLEIVNDSAQQKQIEGQVAEYQHRLNLTPVTEEELTDLLREYDLAKKNYDELYAKRTQSALATDLQKNQQGQQFRLIEPPNLPTKPFSPKRLRIALGGFAGGIFLGVALALFIDTLDTSFHSEKDLHAKFALPLVMALPLSLTARERRNRSLKTAAEWFAGAVLVLAVLAAEFYVYRRG